MVKVEELFQEQMRQNEKERDKYKSNNEKLDEMCKEALVRRNRSTQEQKLAVHRDIKRKEGKIQGIQTMKSKTIIQQQRTLKKEKSSRSFGMSPPMSPGSLLENFSLPNLFTGGNGPDAELDEAVVHRQVLDARRPRDVSMESDSSHEEHRHQNEFNKELEGRTEKWTHEMRKKKAQMPSY
uniref:Uncharacterized protein n=1 Tax=Strombidinopsis acuminata TaxID=141414 RepID=A0A7S3T4R1_9SPIT|mmetsp:Transcript_54383/g.74666  ORF Transcript_54383/g.74666 Transcript_54383/m.74666 type:complete len:181 (+) Transcript_54383:2-544(+)